MMNTLDFALSIFLLVLIGLNYVETKKAGKGISGSIEKNAGDMDATVGILYGRLVFLREIVQPLEAKLYEQATSMVKEKIEDLEAGLGAMDEKYLKPEFWEEHTLKRKAKLHERIQAMDNVDDEMVAESVRQLKEMLEKL